MEFVRAANHLRLLLPVVVRMLLIFGLSFSIRSCKSGVYLEVSLQIGFVWLRYYSQSSEICSD